MSTHAGAGPSEREPAAAGSGPARQQTGAQWALRWHGVVAFLLLLAAVPVCHFGWHGLLGRDEPLVRTRDQTLAPALTGASLLQGQYARLLERHLREDSPVVWQLRGVYNEARWLLGLLQTERVHVGRGGWIFLRPTLHPDLDEFRARAPARQRFLRELQARADALGVHLLVMLVPDKEHMHPEHAYEDGVLPAGKAAVYGQLLAEITAAGIAAVDVAAALAAVRSTDPQQQLYYQRDTHWRPRAALAAALAVAAVLERGPAADRLGPRLPVELGGQATTQVIPDLAAMCGLRTYVVPVGELDPVFAASMTAGKLMEVMETHTVAVRTSEGLRPLDLQSKAATVLLAGTSFTGVSGAVALGLALGRPIRAVSGSGADGLLPLQQALAELGDGTSAARILVWEFVERGVFEGPWRAPALKGRP